jgi:TonB family protein
MNDTQMGGARMMNTESNAKGRVTRVSANPSRAPKMSGGELVATPLPGRGLFYSLLVHGFLVAAVVYVPWSYWLPTQARLVMAQSMIGTHEVLLLPALEPMGSGGSFASSRNSTTNKPKEDAAASSSEAKARQGVVYKGPQLVVSDSPHPDNYVQTIRQPSLVAPPRLPAPLPLPAMVSIASPKPELAPQPAPDKPQDNKPIQVAASQPLSPRVEAPKLSLPPATSADALVHAVVADAVPTPMPKLAHQDPPAKIEKKERNILVIDAYSVPDNKPSAVPPGELYGTFTLSPVGTTALGLAGGGADTKGVPGIGNASGAVTGASAAGVATTPNAGVGNKPVGGSGESKTVRAAAAPGTGTGHGNAGSGNETGNGSGAGLHTLGNGRAPGTGFGSSPFPSIMIQGGSAGNGRSIAGGPTTGTAKPGSAKPQTNYEMTIVANGGSGGGFKDFGVFRDEASYTVYLDMADAGVHGSGWTLQYALDSQLPPVASAMASRTHGKLVPPYATLKSLPSFLPDAAKRGHGGTIVVFGVINRQGKFEDLRIMHSPDTGLDQFMLDALKKWTFRPAEVDGAQVSVRILLGVPVDSVPESNSSVQIGSTRGVTHEATRF